MSPDPVKEKLVIETRMYSSGMRTALSSRCLGRGCLPQCMLGYPLGVGLETPPPGLGLETPLGVGLEPPLGVGLETPPGQTPQLPPPRVWAWRPARHATRYAGIPRAMHAGIPPPPPNRITDTCRNITLPQLRCGR